MIWEQVKKFVVGMLFGFVLGFYVATHFAEAVHWLTNARMFIIDWSHPTFTCDPNYTCMLRSS